MKLFSLSDPKSFIIFTVIAGLLLAGCAPEVSMAIAQSNNPRASASQVAGEDLQALVSGNSAFALDFYQAVRGADGNLFFSPYSLSLALAMTYVGANGETAAQMAEALRFLVPDERLHPAFNALDQQLASRSQTTGPAEEGQKFQLRIANSIWGQADFAFLSAFLDRLAENYGAGLRLLDFQKGSEPAREAINEWISEQTEEKIKDLIPQGGIDEDTRLVLANAIYFYADWLIPFEKERTRPGPFTLLDGRQIEVPMMSRDQPTALRYAQYEGVQVVELPYTGNTAAMLILVPEAGKLAEFEAALDAERLEQVLAGLEPVQVDLVMPKFKFQSKYNLAGTLAGMGMPAAFDPDLADFSGMDGKRDLVIGDVFHQAFVAVDEKGTEAAAATAVVMKLTAMMMVDVKLMVDRPFVFLIRDIPTGTILFAGRVVDPSQ